MNAAYAKLSEQNWIDKQNHAANVAKAVSSQVPNAATKMTNWQNGIMTGNNRRSAQINEMAALNPLQVGLQNMLLGGYMGGGGEFGFGAGAKQANATLARGLASRGISPDSGVAQSALGTALAQMQAADAERRKKYGLQLLQANPAYYNSASARYGDKGGSGWGQVASTAMQVLPYAIEAM